MRWKLFRRQRAHIKRLRVTAFTRLKQVGLFFFGLLIRVKVVGRAAVPLRRSFIVAANHLNGADSIVLQIGLRTRLFFVTSAKWFAGRFSRFFMSNVLDAIPVEPPAADARAANPFGSVLGLRRCIDTLEGGGSIGIYPEGKFNRTDRLDGIQDGTAYLAARTGTPVLPVWIRNLRLKQEVDDRTQARECWTGWLSVAENLLNPDVELVVGEPIVPSPGPPRNSQELEQVMARIKRELRAEFAQLAQG